MTKRLLPLLAAISSWSWAVETEPAVTFEVWYAPHCPHCMEIIRQNLVPLVEAGLPGDRVQLVVHPWREGTVGADGLYQPVPQDFTAIGHMCAFRKALPMPAPIDSPALVNAVKFLACDMKDLIMPGVRRDQASVAKCADSSGLDFLGADGIKACAEGGPNGEGYGLMHSAEYTRLVQAAESHMEIDATTPFVFLNGKLMECTGPTYCDAVWDHGKVMLPTAGSMKDIACSMLDPKPTACGGDVPSEPGRSSTTTAVKFAPCENCNEVGEFRWRSAPPRGPAPALALLLGAAALSGVVLLLRFTGLGGLCRRRSDHTLLDSAELSA